jgi:D-inositol-3-phosphate glycosyltransferase
MLSIHSSPIGPLGTQNTGGMSVYVREVSRLLGAAGHDIDIFTHTGCGMQPVSLDPRVRLIALDAASGPIAKEQLINHLPRLFESLERFRQEEGLDYDLIHSHYWLSGVVGAMAQARWRCPHLTMFHTLGIIKNHTGSGENESARRIAHERWLAKVADHIVVPARSEHSNLTRHYHAPGERLGIIPCGVDLEQFRREDRAAARRRLGIPEQADVMLYVGRFAPLKGIDRLIGALALLRDRFPDLQLLVVGGDGDTAASTRALKRLAVELAVSDKVIFKGRVEQSALPPYYNAADLLALPSHYESFGLVVLEALACGTPVAGTAVGAVASIVTEGVNGSIIASPEINDVADGIARIVALPREERPGGDAVRATVADYGWPRIAAAVARRYQLLLRGHDPAQAPEFYTARNVYPN